MKRECYKCHTPISACMGFVHAGDWVKWTEDKTTVVRELCGRCILVKDTEE